MCSVYKTPIMNLVKYFILFILWLPRTGHAQSNVVGLGPYIIGVTTPDSVNSIDFKEQEQAYVKGTLTLPCTHIRSFKSGRLKVSGLLIDNLSLFFYDNRLFKLTCTYSPELKAAFLAKYGRGIAKPIRYVQYCVQKKDTPLVLRGEAWQNVDVLALAIHWKGYNSDCQQEEANRLTIFSQTILALASDCDLQTTDPFVEAFETRLNDHQEQQKKEEE